MTSTKKKANMDSDFSDAELSDKEMNEIVKDVDKDNNKPKEPETRWNKMKSSVREWGETSSCHGIPHMAAASSTLATIIWALILALCAIGFVALFSDTLRQYLRFDKIVRLNVPVYMNARNKGKDQKYQLGLESTNFPSVTFCNINPYKLSKIKTVPELEALLEVYKNSGDS